MNVGKRALFTRANVVGCALVALAILLTGLVSTATAQDSGISKHRPISGSLANATVSFGLWQTDPPLDRFPNNSPAARNQHDVLPNQARIQAGGAVNFVISGLHQVIVYGNGTQPTAINTNNTTPTTGTPAGVALINDPTNRIYRGLDPSLQARDRVEVVHFPNRGTYLVICGVRGHFVDDGMYGFVRVVGERDD
jgi:hypothetical protein